LAAARKTRPRKVAILYSDDMLTLENSVASWVGPKDRPATAIANIAMATSEPRTAFALSHLSNSAGFPA
jgi:hypothetical protein